MDLSPLHPKFVHIPLALAMLLPLLNLGMITCWWRGWLPRRTWVFVTLLHAIMTFSTFVAMQTGETDEHVAKRVVSSQKIHEHEEAAEVFLLVGILAFLLALIAMIAEEEKVARRFAIGTALLSILCTFLAIAVGEHGGELVYKYGAGGAYMPAQHDDAVDHPYDENL